MWLADSENLIATVIALIRDVGVVGIASLTITLVRFEGGEVVGIGLEWYRKQRYNAGYKAGIEAGIEEGRRLEREAQRKNRSNGKPDTKTDDKGNRQ